MFYPSFSLSQQSDLCKLLGIEELEKHLSLNVLSTVVDLHLDGCGLNVIPNVTKLSHLKVLDLRNNKLEQLINLENIQNVQELQLTGNPIKNS